MTEKEQFIAFLAKAHRNTYAAPPQVRAQHRRSIPLLPGHKEYYFVDGDWEYHDSYAGVSWPPGREVVFFKGNPFWAMSYQGRPTDDSLSDSFYQNEAFAFLRKALMAFTDELPFRGKNEFREGDFGYFFSMRGDWEYFVGRESLTYKDKEIFFQDVMGERIR